MGGMGHYNVRRGGPRAGFRMHVSGGGAPPGSPA
jgi:hypothetical protein